MIFFFAWFNNNGMKTNADKCHLLLSTKKKLKANISIYTNRNSDKEKLLGVTRQPTKIIKVLCSKASERLYAVFRFSSIWLLSINMDKPQPESKQ